MSSQELPLAWDSDLAFDDELWDGFVPVKLLTEDSLEGCKLTAGLAMQLAAMHSRFGKELSALRQAQASRRRALDEHLEELGANRSARAASAALDGALEASAAAHTELGQQVKSSLQAPLEALGTDHAWACKRQVALGKRALKGLATAKETVRAARSAYYAKCADVCNSALKVDELTKGGAGTERVDADVKALKAQQQLETRTRQLDRSRAEYEAAIERANSAQHNAFEVVMPGVLHTLQNRDRERAQKFRDALRACADALRAHADEQSRLADSLADAARAIDPPSDERAFAETHRTKRHRPPPRFVFEPYDATAELSGAGDLDRHGPGMDEEALSEEGRDAKRNRGGATGSEPTARFSRDTGDSGASQRGAKGAPRKASGLRRVLGKMGIMSLSGAKTGGFCEDDDRMQNLEIGTPTEVKHEGHIGVGPRGQLEMGFTPEMAAALGEVNRSLQARNGAPLQAEEAEMIAAMIQANGPGASAAPSGKGGGGEAPTDAGDAADGEEEWFYLSDTGDQVGPCTQAALAKHWADGRLQRSTWVWSPSTDSWKELDELPDLVNTLALIASEGAGGAASARRAEGEDDETPRAEEAGASASVRPPPAGRPSAPVSRMSGFSVDALTNAILRRRNGEKEGGADRAADEGGRSDSDGDGDGGPAGGRRAHADADDVDGDGDGSEDQPAAGPSEHANGNTRARSTNPWA